MRGDFTRFTHKPRKHYAGVLMQQGRVQLDADWNEHFEIQDHRWRVQTIDTIGQCGIPIHAKGFEISATADGSDLNISPGRIYVGGILCESEEATTYTSQPHHSEDFLELAPYAGRTDLVFLDVWRRHVTAVEDSDLREQALGGPDTATRLQTVWQVKFLRDVENIDCDENIADWDAMVASSPARMSSRAAQAPDPSDPCLIAPQAGYEGLENRLYRVEIHEGGPMGTATFKWSRDNASILSTVRDFLGGPQNQIRIANLGRDDVNQFRIGDWVEVFDEDNELAGLPGTLVQILDVDEARRVLSLSQDVLVHAGKSKPRIRRWDQMSDAIVTANSWIELEAGVEVCFSGGPFKPGNYWVVPARTPTSDVEGFTDAPPHGIHHVYCKLALITWVATAAGSLTADVVQCASTFPPLTELPEGGGCCIIIEEGPGLGRRIQEAIDDMPDAGGCVCIPAGIHLLEQPIKIYRRQNITLCGCKGAARVIYRPDKEDSPPGITVYESRSITIRGLRFYSSNSSALIVVGKSQDVSILDCWLVNLPTGRQPSPCVIVHRGTYGITIRQSNLFGGIGVLGMPLEAEGDAGFLKSVRYKEPSRAGMESDVYNLELDRCKVRARLAGIFVRQAEEMAVYRCDVAGIHQDGWNTLLKTFQKLGSGQVPAFEDALYSVFYIPEARSEALIIGIAAFTALGLMVTGSRIQAMVGLLGQALKNTQVDGNHIVGLTGVALLNSALVSITRNEVETKLYGVLGAEIMQGWYVWNNRIQSRNGICFVPGKKGQTLMASAFAALEKGAHAFSRGRDSIYLTEAIYIRAGKEFAKLLLEYQSEFLTDLGSLDTIGWAQEIAIVDNAIKAVDLGICIERAVRSEDVFIKGNIVSDADLAGIRMHGYSSLKNPSELSTSCGHRVEGNRIKVHGVGISVETPDTNVVGNKVFIIGRESEPPELGIIAQVFDRVKVAQYTNWALKTGDAWMMRDGLMEVTLRLERGDLSNKEERALRKELSERVAPKLEEKGFYDTSKLYLAVVEAMAEKKNLDASRFLEAANEKVVSVVGNVGIRLAAHRTSAINNTVRASVQSRGGILLDMPPGENLSDVVDWKTMDIVSPSSWLGISGVWGGGADNPVSRSTSGSSGDTSSAWTKSRMEGFFSTRDVNGKVLSLKESSLKGLRLIDVVVSENEIMGGGGHGVEIRPSVSMLKVSGNRIERVGGNGITSSIGRLVEVEVAHNLVTLCSNAVGGIFLTGSMDSREWRLIDNAVLMCGNDRKMGAFGMVIADVRDVTISRNTIKACGIKNGKTIRSGGLLLDGLRGSLQIADNRIVLNFGSALSAEGTIGRMSLTGNCFYGDSKDKSFLVSMMDLEKGKARRSDVIFSNNHIKHVTQGEDFAVYLTARRAAILGNVWDEGEGDSLFLDVNSYTIVGNVTSNPWFVDDTENDPRREVDHNVIRSEKPWAKYIPTPWLLTISG